MDNKFVIKLSDSKCAGLARNKCHDPCTWKSGDKRKFCSSRMGTVTKKVDEIYLKKIIDNPENESIQFYKISKSGGGHEKKIGPFFAKDFYSMSDQKVKTQTEKIKRETRRSMSRSSVKPNFKQNFGQNFEQNFGQNFEKYFDNQDGDFGFDVDEKFQEGARVEKYLTSAPQAGHFDFDFGPGAHPNFDSYWSSSSFNSNPEENPSWLNHREDLEVNNSTEENNLPEESNLQSQNILNFETDQYFSTLDQVPPDWYKGGVRTSKNIGEWENFNTNQDINSGTNINMNMNMDIVIDQGREENWIENCRTSSDFKKIIPNLEKLSRDQGLPNPYELIPHLGEDKNTTCQVANLLIKRDVNLLKNINNQEIINWYYYKNRLSNYPSLYDVIQLFFFSNKNLEKIASPVEVRHALTNRRINLSNYYISDIVNIITPRVKSTRTQDIVSAMHGSFRKEDMKKQGLDIPRINFEKQTNDATYDNIAEEYANKISYSQLNQLIGLVENYLKKNYQPIPTQQTYQHQHQQQTQGHDSTGQGGEKYYSLAV